MSIYQDNNVFMIYGFAKEGLEDPNEIVKKGIESESLMKVPCLAENTEMAVNLFREKFPDLLIAGVSCLEDLKKEVALLEAYKNENEEE